MTSTVLFFLKLILAILTPFHFHINLRMSLQKSVKKKSSKDFNKNSVDSEDQFGVCCHPNNIKSSAHEQGLTSINLFEVFLQ